MIWNILETIPTSFQAKPKSSGLQKWAYSVGKQFPSQDHWVKIFDTQLMALFGRVVEPLVYVTCLKEIGWPGVDLEGNVHFWFALACWSPHPCEELSPTYTPVHEAALPDISIRVTAPFETVSQNELPLPPFQLLLAHFSVVIRAGGGTYRGGFLFST